MCCSQRSTMINAGCKSDASHSVSTLSRTERRIEPNNPHMQPKTEQKLTLHLALLNKNTINKLMGRTRILTMAPTAISCARLTPNSPVSFAPWYHTALRRTHNERANIHEIANGRYLKSMNMYRRVTQHVALCTLVKLLLGGRSIKESHKWASSHPYDHWVPNLVEKSDISSSPKRNSLFIIKTIMT